MSLVFSCITPHTPMLIPTVAKDRLATVEKTRLAMLTLEQDLYVAQPETILVITPHGDALPDALSINMHPSFIGDFEEFGDLVTKITWKPDTLLIDRFREDFKAKQLPLVLGSREKLDYGSAVPLFYLTAHLPQVKIVILSVAGFDMKTHFDLGKQLKDEIMHTTRRIAVVASADLSHRAGPEAPGGLTPKGAAFDDKILEIIKTDNHADILDIDEEWIAESQTCGAKVLAMMFGLMDEVRHRTDILSYERPLGVGYLVALKRLSF